MVVAVSGGPDSVALLRALIALHDVGPLVIAHLNHQLRGSDSDADEQFVRDLHAPLVVESPHLQLRCERIDIGGQARASGENLEETARRIRYAWLAELARQAGLSCVATGHTADDQAETVLHRLLRGTGLQGLRGIAQRRLLEGSIELLRPLLFVTRTEVLAFLERLQQPFCQDATNADRTRTRNRIRHDLLPHLKQHYNPAIVEVLGRLAAQADETYQEQVATAQKLLSQAERQRAGTTMVFDTASLAGATPAQVRDLFRLIWARERWPTADMTFDHWERLAGIVFGGPAVVELPAGVRARRQGRVIQLSRQINAR